MSDLNELIYNAVSAALADRYVHPIPVFVNLNECARILGISPQTIDRLFIDGALESDRHTTQFNDKGRIKYYMPEILKTLQPSKATIRLFGDQGR